MWITRLVFQRLLAFIYFIAFLIAFQQYVPLLGESGLLPVRIFLKHVHFWDAPSLFWLNSSDSFFKLIALAGLILSVLALTGLSEALGNFISSTVWFLLWLFHSSFVHVGQVFYGFGWESLLIETGFLAIFLGASKSQPPKLIFWLLRWVLFRLMFGAGLIKLRGDSCWLDLTCMNYHYETQPIPNPLSWYFHKLPVGFHKAEVLFTHFVELVVPWAYFFPGRVGRATGLITILFQGTLILSGNLSWLNYITIVIAVACLDDTALKWIWRNPPIPSPLSSPRRGEGRVRGVLLNFFRNAVLTLLTGVILFLSIQPALNLFSNRQLMNASFDPLHLVNTYGAFGSITRERMEVILEGTEESVPTDDTVWKEYEFKCKPGSTARRPCVMSPYHFRIDWQMWFAAMSDFRYHPWILNLTAKLLQGDRRTLSLLAGNPFPEDPPRHVRALIYRYRFTGFDERRVTGRWWKRELAGNYLPPLSLETPAFRELLIDEGWLKPEPGNPVASAAAS